LEERPTPPSETKVAPEPPPKPVRHESRPAKPHEARPQRPPDERHTRTASLHPAARAAPANPASGIGIGRAQSDTNYRGLVVAHLARYKQFPPDARSRGEQGSATVSFSLDGGGRVTRVALVRGSGFASLDHEAQAMVRRASPFPPPPDGHPASFTAPVSFRIQ
jgi:TonB family protein